MYFLKPGEALPPAETANEEGLLAVGGDLTVPSLLDAYHQGIFPWYEESQPVLWWSPDPRMVLFPEKLKISKSMKQLIKKDFFQVSFNAAFEEVIENCAKIKRAGQAGTWITEEMKVSYQELHDLNIAQSVEIWQQNELVGGLYGIYLKGKNIFCGESMFTKVSNASKYGFIKLVEKLQKQDIKLIDCQVFTPHLESLGAEEIPRKEFLKFLR